MKWPREILQNLPYIFPYLLGTETLILNVTIQPSNKTIEKFFEGLTTIDYLIVSPTVALNCLEPAKISFYNSHSASIHFVAHDQGRNLTVLSKLIHHY